MATNLEIHPIQSTILITLLFRPEARFSELNKLDVPSDQFNFHIKALVKSALIEKTGKGYYKLSNLGKEFANRFDTDNSEIERQAKIGVLLCCSRETNGTTEFLLQQRLKQPYYGYWGFITGKVRWGESIFETAARELMEETGLKADLEFVGVKHKTDYDKTGNLLEDKFFFVVKATNTTGKIKTVFTAGKNKWVPKDKIAAIRGLFPDVETTLVMAVEKKVSFKEFKVEVNKY